jgi:D-alanyl-D-alanine dipeptidase
MIERSGSQWCARYPVSRSVDDLDPGWRSQVWQFIAALEKGGASVDITATLRPPERAYLMYWSWMIANLSQAPAAVPPLASVGIDWTHQGDIRAAKSAAVAMVDGYGLEAAPSLESRHVTGRAIDMTIAWNARLCVRDFQGNAHYILTGPHNGSNPELIKVGASYGVIKQAVDHPHWSFDGR